MLAHDFKFKPSQIYITLLLSTIIGAMLILLFMSLNSVLKGLGVIAVAIYGGYVLKQYAWLRSDHSILGIKRGPNDLWYLITPQKTYTATLCGNSTVTSVISVLRFWVPGEKWVRSCVVLRDSLEPEQYRRLLVALKMG